MNEHDELSPDARALLAEVRGADDPSADDRARVRRTLMATIAGTTAGLAASGAASSAAASSAGTAVTLSLGAKIAAVVLVGATAIGGTIAAAPWDEEEPAPVVEPQAPARARRSEPRAAIEPAPVAPVAPAVEDAPIEEVVEAAPIEIAAPVRVEGRVRTAAPEPEEQAPLPSPSTLAEEVGLLRAAQSALNGGDHELALSRLSEHARRFPNGSMAEERDAARVLALCRAGRMDEARALAQRFLRERPSSPLAARVRASCP
jgi:hypothetical protein